MRVKNLNRATRNKSSAGALFAYWEKISGQNAFLCFVKDCINRPSTGGLVQKDSPIDGHWYVVPLCDECNARTGQNLDIWDSANLVPADETGISPIAARSRPVRVYSTAGFVQ